MENWNWSHVNFYLNLLTLLVIPGVVAVARHLKEVRANDLQHLNSKLDLIGQGLIRIEAKLDQHLLDHARR